MELRATVMKSFGGFSLNADITASGTRLGIFGASGSGKSTMVNLLAGTESPDCGSIHLDGECLYSSRMKINVPPQGRRIAIVFQRPHLFPHLSVRGNLLYGFKRCAPGNRKIDLGSLAGILKLEGLLERGVNNLSGGEKQRVAIGRAMLSNPRLLLMDEPLSALDDELKFQIIPYLRTVCEEFGIPFVFISHSMIEMQLMADSVLSFENGSCTAMTSVEDLARRSMGKSQVGYINLLRVGKPLRSNGLNVYAWGGGELFISAQRDVAEGIFELSSRNIILFKKHPEAISARNLLRCRVSGTFAAGNKVGIELDCGGERLIAEVVREAASELEIREGAELFAAIKATAFRHLA